jgi:hypothetical protein
MGAGGMVQRSPSAARHGRRLRNSRTLATLLHVIYAHRLCHWKRHRGSTVLAETPPVSALLGASQGLAEHGEASSNLCHAQNIYTAKRGVDVGATY